MTSEQGEKNKRHGKETMGKVSFPRIYMDWVHLGFESCIAAHNGLARRGTVMPHAPEFSVSLISSLLSHVLYHKPAGTTRTAVSWRPAEAHTCNKGGMLQV